ncbi:MAG TPA: DUF2269 domain-containing protein [Crenalkalicoccus sp.]|jgi:uncharacterized membrane protein|nr:DUF2269 domain-containing protein [Crenalkalicoccus sp.]
MDGYVLLKYVHVVSSALLFGTGLGTAFHGWMAHRTGDRAAVAVTSRNVVLADWLFTAPAVVVQPVTGAAMALQAGIPLTSNWLLASILLYLLVGACWLPVVWLQIRMHALAEGAVRAGTTLPPRYFTYARLWFALGWPAFISVLVIFYLMIAKPELW